MAGYNSSSDPDQILSSSENDNNNDVFGDSLQQALWERKMSTSTFYGSRGSRRRRNLRPRKSFVPTSQSGSSASDKEALCCSDDSDRDPDHVPKGNRSNYSTDMFPYEDDTSKAVTKLGRPRGSQSTGVRKPVRRGSGTRGRPRGVSGSARGTRGSGRVVPGRRGLRGPVGAATVRLIIINIFV